MQGRYYFLTVSKGGGRVGFSGRVFLCAPLICELAKEAAYAAPPLAVASAVPRLSLFAVTFPFVVCLVVFGVHLAFALDNFFGFSVTL